MTSTQEEVSTSIIKADRTGRSHYSQQYKDDVLNAFEQSSLSGAGFAEQCGIKYPTFASWVAKRKRASQTKSDDSTPAFLIAEVADTSGSVPLEVYLPGGATVRASNSQEIRLLAELLRHLACC